MSHSQTLDPPSRGVIILGMHRSGTSAVTRGVQALGADLGGNFLETRFDNPTGYWEDKAIVDLHDRLLSLFGMTWEDARLIDESWWASSAVRLYVSEARHYFTNHLLKRPVWAFKDPRTLRLLPLWQDVMRPLSAEHVYLLVLRNPLSVAASLYRRQKMVREHALRLWLAYVVPHLSLVANERLCVLDFDHFMDNPPGQLGRLANRLGFPQTSESGSACSTYLNSFLNSELRHERCAYQKLTDTTNISGLCGEVYGWLRCLAEDELTPLSPSFQEVWPRLVQATRVALAA